MKLNKKGNILVVFLSIFIVVILVLIFSAYVIYTQINAMVYPIKQDIFYIVQNSYFSLNEDDLKFYEYSVDVQKLKEKVTNLINLNHKDKVVINTISYDNATNRVIINYDIILSPLVFKSVLGDKFSINISDNIKLKSMEVK